MASNVKGQGSQDDVQQHGCLLSWHQNPAKSACWIANTPLVLIRSTKLGLETLLGNRLANLTNNPAGSANSREAKDNISTFYQDKGRCAAHAILGHQHHLLVDVYQSNSDIGSQGLCGLFDSSLHQFARDAPTRPKIEEHWYRAIFDLLLEVFFGDRYCR